MGISTNSSFKDWIILVYNTSVNGNGTWICYDSYTNGTTSDPFSYDVVGEANNNCNADIVMSIAKYNSTTAFFKGHFWREFSDGLDINSTDLGLKLGYN